MPRVSVVVPTYNNGRHVAATIESILAQSMEDFELVIADHSSQDDTLPALSGFRDDPRVTVMTTESGGGAVRNWNRVSQAGTAPYVKLVCGDDIVHPQSLAVQADALDRNPGAAMVAARRRIVDDAGAVLIPSRGLAGLTGNVPGSLAVRSAVRAGTNIFGEPAAVMLRREALESVGWWDSRFPYVIDLATYVRILQLGTLVAIPEVLADFRVSPTQWSVRLSSEQARQMRAFHQWVRSEWPADVSQRDVRQGDLLATTSALARRVVYWGLELRTGRAATPSSR